MTKTSPQLQIHSNYLWFLTLAYSMVLVFANWFDARLVKIFTFVTDAGTFIFPLTFLLSDLITEVYGYKYARRAIWCGFLFNLIFLLYGLLIIHLPSPEFATQNALFDAIITINSRILLASISSYFISEPFNAFILAKLKIKMKGQFMALRFIASTVIAAAIDSTIFGMIAFYGTMMFNHLLLLIFSMWTIKVVIEILGLPISVFIATKLKTIENIDMYDKHTNFSLFTLDTSYTSSDNALQEE